MLSQPGSLKSYHIPVLGKSDHSRASLSYSCTGRIRPQQSFPIIILYWANKTTGELLNHIPVLGESDHGRASQSYSSTGRIIPQLSFPICSKGIPLKFSLWLSKTSGRTFLSRLLHAWFDQVRDFVRDTAKYWTQSISTTESLP